MPAKTGSNHPNHVETQSAKIAAEIEPILKEARMGTITGSTVDDDGNVISAYGYTGIINVEELTEKLVAYIMAYQEADWYSGYVQGYQAARDGKEMTDKEAYDQLPEGHGARKR